MKEYGPIEYPVTPIPSVAGERLTAQPVSPYAKDGSTIFMSENNGERPPRQNDTADKIIRFPGQYSEEFIPPPGFVMPKNREELLRSLGISSGPQTFSIGELTRRIGEISQNQTGRNPAEELASGAVDSLSQLNEWMKVHGDKSVYEARTEDIMRK